MASIKKRPNGRWRARYRDASGREIAKHFDRKVDGQQWLDEVTASVVRGDYVDPKAGRITVASYATQWESVRVHSDGSARIVDNALRLHLLPALGAYPLASVLPTQVQGFVHGLEAKGLAPGSVRNIYDVTARVFEAAVYDRKIPRTPCVKIRLPSGGGVEVVPPTVEEIDAVRVELDPRYRAALLVLSGSGLRIGEFLGLGMFDVNYLGRSIRVERQRLQTNALADLKTKASRRTVPIGQVVVDGLTEHLREFPGTDEALFVDEWGKPLSYSRWKKMLAAAAGRAGVELTSHDLRHFAASALISGGASVKQVQAFLGHASAVITLRTYAHLFPGDEDRTRVVLDAALGPLADSSRTEGASNA
ncbi:site-specific integrase [Nocardioides oleivorans]|uniref:Site-specific integrase n=1 Tax=Nocardioides oleivorans TaxID=273676 RepID=A0A4Q2RPY7_9ACTN|nr:site-specific integrase [Nocardioides oleivorans]RYB91010.1 site-specific integrase [Nocardioides oleivorans]